MRSSRSLGKTEPEKFFIQKYLEGVIDVYSDGRVHNNKTGRFIGATSTGGYPKISMSRGTKDILHIQVHRLVYLIHGGDIPEGMEINHKDCDHSNASIDNLECVTKFDNIKHFIGTGRKPRYCGSRNHNASFDLNTVKVIKSKLAAGLPVKELAKAYGVSGVTIYSIKNGITYKDD